MTSVLSAEDFDDLHDFIRVQVAAGYAPADEIVEEAVEQFADSDLDAQRAAGRRRGDHRAGAGGAPRRAGQLARRAPTATGSTPPSPSSTPAGILARQHFSCCGTCGAEEIKVVIQQTAKAGLPARGFTFFHVAGHRVRGGRRVALPQLRLGRRRQGQRGRDRPRGHRRAAAARARSTVERQARPPHRPAPHLAAPPPLTVTTFLCRSRADAGGLIV